jgi:hypothetical protein
MLVTRDLFMVKYICFELLVAKESLVVKLKYSFCFTLSTPLDQKNLFLDLTFDRRMPRKPCLVGGVPAYRQAGRGTIKTIFPLLAIRSPLRAREALACLSRPDGVAGGLQI